MSHKPHSATTENPLSAATQHPSCATALSQEGGAKSRKGVRTYLLLTLAMTLVTVIITGLCLLLIRGRLLSEVHASLSQDLSHSFASFEDMQAERLSALDRENALLANLPTLKALMTSRDDLTIQDGAVEFWNISGTDLFALADSNGRIVASFTRGGASPSPYLQQELTALLARSGQHYLLDSKALYACSLRPLYFGSAESGSLLGYVISGAAIDRTVRQISHPAGVDAAFVSDGHIVASTLDAASLDGLSTQPMLSGTPASPAPIQSGKTRYLAATEDLSVSSTAPLQLVILKSLAPAEASIHRIDSMILSVGLLALVCGAVLMLTVSHLLTSPLEELARSVRAFATGDGGHQLPRTGTREVLELSETFASMRDEIQRANRALLESERLATIGRMASSISHDFRHYLASIYANAEFLLSSRIEEQERAEIFEEIRSAVLGSTEMIESLLIFSRTGKNTRSLESIPKLMEQAIALVRVHPDGEGVRIAARCSDAGEALAMVDGKQIERAIFNLLLNSCQAARIPGVAPHVLAILETTGETVILTVTDNGAGVPETLRSRLFDPFVSEGKQKGTGLGLTLVSCIAVDHGGDVQLVSSRPGETIFRMKLARNLPQHSDDEPASGDVDSISSSIAHESLQP